MAQLREEDYLQWVKLIRWALKGIEPFLAKRFEVWEGFDVRESSVACFEVLSRTYLMKLDM